MLDSAKLRKTVRRVLPGFVRRWVWVWRRYRHRTPVSRARLGSLRRVTPISRAFGRDRGQPIDRYYVESFLARQAGDIRGRVLEIGDDSYAQRFGGNRVAESDVLGATEGDPQATVIAALTGTDHIPSDAFDCVILTQQLQLVYDVRAAIETLYRILKPGGVLLATFPGVSQIGHKRRGDYWYWSFTRLLARRLFGETFPAANVEVESYGNVLAAISLLHGLAVEELPGEKVAYNDRDYEVVISLRAVKPGAAA